MRCRTCGGQITRWKTGRNEFEGLSGVTCECGMSHTIDQYPLTFQTRRMRRRIAKLKNVSRFSELDWFNEEEKLKNEQK